METREIKESEGEKRENYEIKFNSFGLKKMREMFLIVFICNKRKQATFFFSFLLYFPHTVRAGIYSVFVEGYPWKLE
jgi:hypothetical protein